MMRITLGLFCALVLGFACSSTDHGSGKTPDAPAGFVCGDGVCAASEVNNCPQDCGQQVGAVCGNGMCESSKGETSQSCPADCGSSGSGSSGGSGSGSSTFDCNDPNTQFGCLACELLQQCNAPYDAVSCAACGGIGSGFGSGFGSGSGLGSACPTGCNCDGVCDSGETSANCPLDNCP